MPIIYRPFRGGADEPPPDGWILAHNLVSPKAARGFRAFWVPRDPKKWVVVPLWLAAGNGQTLSPKDRRRLFEPAADPKDLRRRDRCKRGGQFQEEPPATGAAVASVRV